MAVDPGLIPNYTSRSAIDSWIASNAGQYSPAQVNDIAQALSENTAGVSFQELQSRLAENAAQPTASYTGAVSAPQVRLSDKINALNDLYNLIYQDLGTMTKEQRGKIEQGYGQQAQSAQTGYEQTARALPLQYGALGVGDSSYYAKAAGTASDMYNQAIKQIQTEKEQKLAELGKMYQQQMTGLQSAQSQLASVPQYGTQAEASQLESQIGSLAQQRAGLGTQAGYLGALQNIAPSSGTTTAKLQEQLSNLSSSSIPTFAKQTIAKGQIEQSGLTPEQQTYYTDYFQKLQQQGTPSVGA
jgi:hypothetical protein